MTQRRHLSFWPAVGILLCFILLQILISTGLHEFGIADYRYGDPRGSVIQVLAYGLLFSTLMHLCHFGYRDLFGPTSLGDIHHRSFVILGIALVLGGSWFWLTELITALDRFLPKDPGTLVMLERFMGGGVISFITIGVIAPVCEEMLFRGIILRGFLAHYSAITAILLSSLLFSLIHMNWFQIPFTFVFGLFLGWLYFRSRSLWPSILAHMAQNMAALTIWTMEGVAPVSNPLLSTVSLLVSVVGLRLLSVCLPKVDGY